MASNTENRGVNIYLNANAADDTLKQLNKSARLLKNELANLPRGSQEFAEKSKVLEEVNFRLSSLRQEAKGVRDDFKKTADSAKISFNQINDSAGDLQESFANLKGELTSLGKLAVTSIIGGSLLDVAKNIISQNAELSDSFAGVMKTTGLTEVQVGAVNRSLSQINTRTPRAELLGLAQVAGKLGYSSVQDVEGFVRAADKIGVALGEDLGGTEQAVNELGKLLDIFKIKQEFGIESGLLKVGSAINDLGASGTANEKNLIDFSTRLAGIAPAAKISLPNVLGIASVMDELGQSVQTSSTAIGQFIVGMGTDIPKFAKIAKMDVQAFANLLRDDANEAMMRVLSASKTTGGGIAQLAKNMKELDVTGSEGRAAIGALADNIDLVRKRQDESNESFQKGTSINGEFNTVNNNLAGNLEKLGNKMATMWQNSGIRTWLTNITGWLSDNRSEFDKLSDSYEAQKTKSENLETAGGELLKRYDQLKGKAQLNKDEQIELKDVIQKIALLIPEAITQWDRYGDVIDINRQKVNELTSAQKRLVKEMNISTVNEGNKEIENLEKSIAKDERALKFARQDQKYQFNQNLKDRVQREDIDPLIESIAKKRNQILEVGGKIQQLGGDVNKIGRDYLIAFGKDGQSNGMYDYDKSLAAGKIGKNGLPKKITLEDAEIVTPEGKKKKTGKSQAEKDAEASQKLYQKLVNDEQLFNAEKYRNQLAENEKTIAAEQAKYDALISAWEGFRDKAKAGSFEQLEAIGRIEFLKADKEKEVGDLRRKQEGEISEAIGKIRTDMSKKLLTELDKERIRINDHYDKLKKDAGTNLDQQAQIEEARQKDLTDAGIREEERLKDETKLLRASTTGFIADEHTRRLAEIDVQYKEELIKLQEKYSKELLEKKLFEEAKKALDAKYQQKRDEENGKVAAKRSEELKDLTLKAAEDISNAVFQIGANNRQAELDLALSNIDKAREKELANKNLTEAQKKAINEKYDKQVRAEKLKTWKADKNASLLQAGINTALAITKALPNIPLSIAAGVAGAAQMAVIAATKPPQFFHGGFTPGKEAKGWVREPTMFTNSFGNVFSAGENRMPEYVVSSAQLQDPRVADFVNMLESNRTNHISSLSNSPVIVQNNTNLGALEAKMEMLIQAYASTQDKKVIMVYQDLEDMQTKKVGIINSVNS